MTALGDTLYVLGLLIPVVASLRPSNYILTAIGFIMGTVAFLVFVTGQTDIAFSASTFYLAFLPMGLGLFSLALFINWLREERW